MPAQKEDTDANPGGPLHSGVNPRLNVAVGTWAESICLSIVYQWRIYIQYQPLLLGSISLLGACRSRIPTRLNAAKLITAPPQDDVQWSGRGFGSHFKSRAASAFQAQEHESFSPSQAVRLFTQSVPASAITRHQPWIRGRIHAHVRGIDGRKYSRLQT